jgi:hypothetical protein
MTFDFNEEFEQDIEDKEFSIWLQNGIDRGWVSKPFCYTHEGDPYMTDEESQEWEDGGDPCCFVAKFLEN